MAAETISTQEIATNTVSNRRACADSSAAAANKAMASTKSACANAMMGFEAAWKSPEPATPRNAAYATQAAAHASRYCSRKTRKNNRLAATTIRAAVSRAVNQGMANMPTEFPNIPAGCIDRRTNTYAFKYHAGCPSLPDFRLQLVTFG